MAEIIKQFFVDWSAMISATSAFLAALATVLYVIFTYHLLAATKLNTDITARTFQILNRPYIAITSFEPVASPPGFSFSIKNVGTVPGTFSLQLLVVQKDRGEVTHILVPSEVLFPQTVRTISFPFFKLPQSFPCPILTIKISYKDAGDNIYITDREVHFDPENTVLTDVRSYST